MNCMPNEVFRVAEILSPSQIVLNVGTNRQIEFGDEFIVYSSGDKMIVDPKNGVPLGYLEIYRGVGHVISIQERMCIIQAIPNGTDRRLKLFSSEEGTPIFYSPSIGDYAKPNATKVPSSKKN